MKCYCIKNYLSFEIGKCYDYCFLYDRYIWVNDDNGQGARFICDVDDDIYFVNFNEIFKKVDRSYKLKQLKKVNERI